MTLDTGFARTPGFQRAARGTSQPTRTIRVRRRKRRFGILLAVCLVFSSLGLRAGDSASAKRARAQATAATIPHAPSISLSPAVIMLQAKPGQSTTQTLTVSNQTAGQFAFELDALDVVVRDGKRVFVPAGETVDGIARTAVFSPRTLLLGPGEHGMVRVTVTVPDRPVVRAIVALFQGKSVVAINQGVGMTGSLGALITFTLSKQFRVDSLPLGMMNATASENLSLTETLINSGSEPVIPKGTLAIVGSSGALIGKVPIAAQRLLPGEQLDFTATYPAPLKPGKYRALISLKHEGGLLTRSLDFLLP
ncbi:MAG: hypothetical protein WAQ52_06375 [Terriglobales bacterium]